MHRGGIGWQGSGKAEDAMVTASDLDALYWKLTGIQAVRWIETLVLLVGTYHCVRYVVLLGRFVRRRLARRSGSRLGLSSRP